MMLDMYRSLSTYNLPRISMLSLAMELLIGGCDENDESGITFILNTESMHGTITVTHALTVVSKFALVISALLVTAGSGQKPGSVKYPVTKIVSQPCAGTGMLSEGRLS